MCSIFDALPRFQQSDLTTSSEVKVLVSGSIGGEIPAFRSPESDTESSYLRSLILRLHQDLTGWCTAFAYIARLVAYFAVLALIVLIMLVILKYLAERDDDQSPVERFRHFRSPPLTPTETTPLRPEKAAPTTTYRSCEEGEGGDDDIESGSSSSSEELYDGKICVICYDEERNCFFVPCGHCATCYCCAQR
ncbi:hypothetical protein SAY87_026871 [Trapa incisa]|uniref:RING-type domain-containing protein n=1 Tax=Trapa incisa TaxID=236973 RepID=A0AAN7JLP4_9MYRT|nr:hypothetical protein SAY87_026871 [Trapa incisa]